MKIKLRKSRNYCLCRYLSSNLIATLAGLNMNDLTHFLKFPQLLPTLLKFPFKLFHFSFLFIFRLKSRTRLKSARSMTLALIPTRVLIEMEIMEH